MKHKRTLFTFSRGDFKAVERYLNEQAQKGWELEKAGIFAKWKQTERRDLSYCVDLAKPKQDREDRLDYVEFCAEGGWELTAFAGQMYIFKSKPGTHAIPVQTDPELEKKNYNKYYIRNTILSVLILAVYLGFWLAVGTALGNNLSVGIREFYSSWTERWYAAGLVVLWPVWALWGLWKLIDFVRAIVMGRTGKIGNSPRWVMWTNCVLGFLSGLAFALWLLCDALDVMLIAGTTSTDITIFVLCILWAGSLFYQALKIEQELFKRERRRYITAGIVLVAVFALLIAGRVMTPYGQWDTNPFGGDEDAMEQYARLEDLPVVRGEDVGRPLSEEKTEYFYLTHEFTPMGEHWELENYYRDMQLSKMGCDTYLCTFLWQAELVEEQILEDIAWWLESTNQLAGARIVVLAPPLVEMEQITLDWADSAWYGANETASVLVVRIGNQVTRLAYPAELMRPELLPAIEERLCG